MKILSALAETVLTIVIVPLVLIGFLFFFAGLAGLFMCLVTGTKEGILPCTAIIFGCVFLRVLLKKLSS